MKRSMFSLIGERDGLIFPDASIHGGNQPRAQAVTETRSADLDWQLGFGRGPAPGRAIGRWMAGLGVQYDAGPIRRRIGKT